MARNSAADLEDREKSKNIGSLRGLLPFMAPHRWWIFAAFCALVVTAAISLVLPIAVRRVVDGFGSATNELMDRYFIAALVVAVGLAIGTGLRYYLVTRVGERIVSDIRIAVFNRMMGMSPAFFERIMTGEVLSRITTDTTLILSVIGSSVSVALRNFMIFIGGIVLMLFTSAKLAGLVLLIVPAVIIPIIVLGRRLRTLGRDNQEWIAKSSGNASEALLSVQTVQAFTHEPISRDNFATLTEYSFASARTRIKTRAVMTVIVISLIFSGVVGVLWIGMRDVNTGALTIGALVQFVIYAVMVAGAVGALSEIWSEIQRASGATERLVELLNSEDLVHDLSEPSRLPAQIDGNISFKDVTFSYPARQNQAALEQVSFDIKAGETVALVGPSGAGKSTVIQLLLRFYDPVSGDISIDNKSLRNLSREDFRKSIALVPQDAVIFAASARENIRFGRPEASDAEVETAARAAAADTFLKRLPEGYDTYVGERGVMLSGGQKQRIAIARAILRDAPILLLDEATSALDAASEKLVQAAVDELAQGRTTLIIAHRLATIKKADRILVFDDGQLIAQGTHDALVRENGLYAKLARLQFTDGFEDVHD